MSTSAEPGDGGAAVHLHAIQHALGTSGDTPVTFRLEELSVDQGERVALTGPSGCGKSTLLHLVSGLVRPDRGTVRVLGAEIRPLSQSSLDRFRGTQLGFIFQTFQLLGAFTALENVLIGLRFGKSFPRRKQKERATSMLERVGLGRRLHHRPHRLSVGERQRVAIARALANRPRLLLADEPTGALDPSTGEGIFTLLNDVCAEENCALLFVTHDLSLAARLPRQFDCRGLIVHPHDGGAVTPSHSNITTNAA